MARPKVKPELAVARPFLKWAGGKRRLLSQMQPYWPKSFGRYHEPFVGSAAVFFSLMPKRARLSDNNDRLVRTYRGLRDDTDQVIALLLSYPHDKSFFLEMREREIDEAGDAEVAAWFIYLNKTGYNGLYRVNRKNRFNVPFGQYARPKICDEANLRSCAKMLKNTKIGVGDFEQSARRARKGDLVYFDPPYVPLSATSSFTAYTSDGFGVEEQERLRDLALALKKRGVHVLISNSSAVAVRELYQDDFEIISVSARRAINCKPQGRGKVKEFLIR